MSVADRRRDASFVAPDNTEHFFQVDSLERSGGKKGATQEIVDSKESISQDQGNKAESFSMPIYFVGSDYDLKANNFYDALHLKYTLNNPGELRHPIWGNINVFPFSWTQKEELVKEGGISKISVTFREVFPKKFPESDLDSLTLALNNLNDLMAEAAATIDNVKMATAQAITNIKGKILLVTGTITKGLKLITSVVKGVNDEINTIRRSIEDTIDSLGASIMETKAIVNQVQILLQSPARIKTTSLDKINKYRNIVQEISDIFNDKNQSVSANRKNNAQMLQLIGGFAVAATAEAAVFTEYETRGQALAAIDIINDTYSTFLTTFEESRVGGSASEEFSGDHNFFSLLHDTIARINELLLNQSFDLKAEKKYTLKVNSDIITECYNNYKKVDNNTIEFFIQTNNIILDEFNELPAGREIVIYI